MTSHSASQSVRQPGNETELDGWRAGEREDEFSLISCAEDDIAGSLFSVLCGNEGGSQDFASPNLSGTSGGRTGGSSTMVTLDRRMAGWEITQNGSFIHFRAFSIRGLVVVVVVLSVRLPEKVIFILFSGLCCWPNFCRIRKLSQFLFESLCCTLNVK